MLELVLLGRLELVQQRGRVLALRDPVHQLRLLRHAEPDLYELVRLGGLELVYQPGRVYTRCEADRYAGLRLHVVGVMRATDADADLHQLVQLGELERLEQLLTQTRRRVSVGERQQLPVVHRLRLWHVLAVLLMELQLVPVSVLLRPPTLLGHAGVYVGPWGKVGAGSPSASFGVAWCYSSVFPGSRAGSIGRSGTRSRI